MGGGWSTPRLRRFIAGKDPVPIVQQAGRAPGPVWTGAESLAPHRDSIPGPSSPCSNKQMVNLCNAVMDMQVAVTNDSMTS